MSILDKIPEIEQSLSKTIYSRKSSIWNEILNRSSNGKKFNLEKDLLQSSMFLKNCGCMPDFTNTDKNVFINRFCGTLNETALENLKYPNFGKPGYLLVKKQKIPSSHLFKLSTLLYINETLEALGYREAKLRGFFGTFELSPIGRYCSFNAVEISLSNP